MSATGNPNTADFLDMMPSTVTVEPFASSDTYGAPVYGPLVSYRCHVSNKASYIRGPSGEMIVTKGAIWIACASDAFTAKARLTLPNGAKPILLAINGAQDETGTDIGTRVDFG